jgi:hypothetical protein
VRGLAHSRKMDSIDCIQIYKLREIKGESENEESNEGKEFQIHP